MLFSSLTSLIKNQIQTSSQLVIPWPSRSSSTKRKWQSTRKSLKSWSRTVFPSSISWLCRSSWRESKSHKEGLQDLDYSQLSLRRGRWMPYELLQTNGWSDTSIFSLLFLWCLRLLSFVTKKASPAVMVLSNTKEKRILVELIEYISPSISLIIEFEWYYTSWSFDCCRCWTSSYKSQLASSTIRYVFIVCNEFF